MGKGVTGLLIGAFVGVFAGALAYEVLRKSGVPQAIGRKVAGGFKSAGKAFKDGYKSARPAPAEIPESV